MALIGEKEKQDIIKKHQLHEGDVGSSDVQVAILTERINHLVEHLKKNKKDNHTRRGLIILVGRREKLLKYLSRKNRDSYLNLVKKLKLKTKY
jgi:small subunit ribosomal protein S15